MPANSQIKNYSQEVSRYHRRLLLAFLLMVCLIAVLIGRLVSLQIIDHAKYTTMSRDNQINLIPVAPNRGLIYDRNGVLLAENVPAFSLDLIPDHVKNTRQTIAELQKIIDISPDEIDEFYKMKKQHHRYEPVPLKLNLSEEQLAKFYVNRWKFPGVKITARMMRHYPMGKAMASVIGYVGRINENELQHIDKTNYSASNYIGKVGIERYYEHLLHGTVGYDEVEMDASGHIVRTMKNILPTPGADLYLSIDSKLQVAAEDALGDHRGAVVAIDPQTGEVLALVSNPSYDPNLFVKGISSKQFNELQNSPERPLYNRAIRGQYPLASTIKPYMAIQGLDSGEITPQYTIYDPGWFKLPNNKHIYKDWKKHGYVNVTKAIIVSCDTFFYGLSVKIGIKGMDDILDAFGFGKYTNIDMEEELPGLIPSPAWKLRRTGQPWYTGDTVNSSIGQGFMLATPLQLAHAVATLSLRGKGFQPKLLHKYQQANGIDVQEEAINLPTVELQHQNVWQVVIDAMEGVINNPSGTGYAFGRNPPYTVAAKTGTGQVYKPARYEDLPNSNIPEKYRSHSLFIAYAPVEDPKIAIAVVVEHTPGYAPIVARKVIDEYLLTENMLPKKTQVTNE